MNDFTKDVYFEVGFWWFCLVFHKQAMNEWLWMILRSIFSYVVVSTHLKNMLVKLDHETPSRNEHKKLFIKPLPS